MTQPLFKTNLAAVSAMDMLYVSEWFITVPLSVFNSGQKNEISKLKKVLILLQADRKR